MDGGAAHDDAASFQGHLLSSRGLFPESLRKDTKKRYCSSRDNINFAIETDAFRLLGDLSGLSELGGTRIAGSFARIASSGAGIASLSKLRSGGLGFLSGLLGVEIASNSSTHEGYDCERHKNLFHCTLNLTELNKTNFVAANVGVIFEFSKLLKKIYYL